MVFSGTCWKLRAVQRSLAANRTLNVAPLHGRSRVEVKLGLLMHSLRRYPHVANDLRYLQGKLSFVEILKQMDFNFKLPQEKSLQPKKCRQPQEIHFIAFKNVKSKVARFKQQTSYVAAAFCFTMTHSLDKTVERVRLLPPAAWAGLYILF